MRADFFQDWRAKTPWGDRPDFGRGEVRSWLKDSIDMLLNEYQVDGLRWDATAYVRNVDGGNGDYGAIPSVGSVNLRMRRHFVCPIPPC